MICPKCGGEMQLQAVSELQRRGCVTVLLYIVLLCIPVIGWIALFMLLRGRKSKTTTYAVCQKCGCRALPKNVKTPKQTNTEVKREVAFDAIKKIPVYPRSLDGHPVKYIYVLKFCPTVDIKRDVLNGQEKIVDVESGDGCINIVYNGSVVGFVNDEKRLKMLRDWEEKGLPRNGVILSDGDSLNLRFYLDRRVGNDFREQTVVKLRGFSSEAAQDEISVLDEGSELDLMDGDSENDVFVSHDGTEIGKLPKEQAKRFLEEGAFGAFFEKAEEGGEKQSPYIRIYW